MIAFAVRALGAEQPIVENYVGRQVPTAMVARNLERGGSFLRPTLDTGPFPNYFLVEPPLFAWCAVSVERATGLDLSTSGRLASAAGIALAVWGLFGLVQRRQGTHVALLAAAALAVAPIAIRYGRAFHGDALMLGCLVAGLRCWDEFAARGTWPWLVAAWGLGAVALALKLIAVYMLVPLAVLLCRAGRSWRWLLVAVSMILPALAWYVHAGILLAQGIGSHASADNLAIWAQVLVPGALAHSDTYFHAGRFLLVRAFTPVGAGLALYGLFRLRDGDRLWTAWGLSAAAILLLVAAKLHHEYYWLAIAPLAAVGIGSGLVDLAGRGARGRAAACALGAGYMMLAGLQSASTWRTPSEWAGLEMASAAVRQHVPEDAWLVAPEALLFASDRRGCRLETGPKAGARAAGEWGGRLSGDDPAALVEFYRARGAGYVADLVTSSPDAQKKQLHDSIRSRYVVLVDRPGVLVAKLTGQEGRAHVQR
jgi:4-amino-4-deoxy-L-arabinose transferase-like glycosyltransferase